jgi:hypothetical protein
MRTMDAPPRVDDVERYWTDVPPELSARCLWWKDRIAGGWTPNKRIRRLGYYEMACYLGVYIWEWLKVLRLLVYP